MTSDGPTPVRPVPRLTDLNRIFWTSGRDGVLQLQKCSTCKRIVHPPVLRCPHDHAEMGWATVSGEAQLESWTVNDHPWFSWIPERHIIAFVRPIEDPRVRLLTNLVDIDPVDLHEGMTLHVTFEQIDVDDDSVFVPLFGAEPPRDL